MNLSQFCKTIDSIKKSPKYFLSINFGCRVNAAETNLLSQVLINKGYIPIKLDSKNNPVIILVNTCAVTKKGELESIRKVNSLRQNYPDSYILVTGCANLDKLEKMDKVLTFSNAIKEEIISTNDCLYTKNIKDKFSHTHRYILKIQSGCNHFCSYCIVPFKRQTLWSLSINDAVNLTQQIVQQGYKEIIITGINLNLYQPGLSNLIETLLEKTGISLISFGSFPLNCIDQKFIKLYSTPKYSKRLSNFLHIPLQSGSDKILKLMNRPYNRKRIEDIFNKLKKISLSSKGDVAKRQRGLFFGTDIIVGFPGETNKDFNQTLKLCKNIGFQKIHTFRFSPRSNTLAKIFFDTNTKLDKQILKNRSNLIQKLSKKDN